jgi:hypothetical protein
VRYTPFSSPDFLLAPLERFPRHQHRGAPGYQVLVIRVLLNTTSFKSTRRLEFKEGLDPVLLTLDPDFCFFFFILNPIWTGIGIYVLYHKMLPQTGLTYHSCRKNWSAFHCVQCYGKFFHFAVAEYLTLIRIMGFEKRGSGFVLLLTKKDHNIFTPDKLRFGPNKQTGRFRTWLT